MPRGGMRVGGGMRAEKNGTLQQHANHSYADICFQIRLQCLPRFCFQIRLQCLPIWCRRPPCGTRPEGPPARWPTCIAPITLQIIFPTPTTNHRRTTQWLFWHPPLSLVDHEPARGIDPREAWRFRKRCVSIGKSTLEIQKTTSIEYGDSENDVDPYAIQLER